MASNTYSLMPRYKLRTLLIVLAVMPPLLAWVWLMYAQISRAFADFNAVYSR